MASGVGCPVITELVNLFDYRSGGNPYHTGMPAPHFITSRLRSMFLENLEYSEFDMRPADAHRDQAVGRHDDRPHPVWRDTARVGRSVFASTPVECARCPTGRIRVPSSA